MSPTTESPPDLPSRASARSTLLAAAWRVFRFAAVAYLIILLVLAFFENSFVYPVPLSAADGSPPYGFEDMHFKSPGGPELHGWFAEAENPRAVILYCHGNAEHVGHNAELLRSLRDELQVSVLIFDYRGYGRSAGRPSEAGVLADARAARRWLAEKAGVREEQIVLMGRSLGGGVAVDLATDGARGLILENTFTSLPDVAATSFPWLPLRWIMRNRFNSIDKIGQYQGPLLVSHGTADRVVPYRLGERLFRAANEPKEFFPIPGGRHNQPQPPDYYQALDEFITKLKEEENRDSNHLLRSSAAGS